MAKLRAIYIGDMRFDNCPVFELNEETDMFEMIENSDAKYSREAVEEDSDFIIGLIVSDHVTILETK